MHTSTLERALPGIPVPADGTHTSVPAATVARPAARPRTRVAAGVVAGLVAALTFTLLPGTGAASAATPVAAAVDAAAPAPRADVDLRASRASYVKGSKGALVTARVSTGATPTEGTVTFYDGRKKLKKKKVGASGKVSYRLPRTLSVKKHTIRATFRPSAATAATVGSGTDTLKIRVKSRGSAIAAVAKKFVGVRYVRGGSSPRGFDCSGFTSYVYDAANVAQLPRSSSAQRHVGKVVSRSKAQPGDLIWTPGHVAIYLGKGKQIDAPRPGTTIQVRAIWQSNPTFIRV